MSIEFPVAPNTVMKEIYIVNLLNNHGVIEVNDSDVCFLFVSTLNTVGLAFMFLLQDLDSNITP